MIVHERRIRFEEVDAAGLVFFGHFVGYAHEALEKLFAGLDGGYAALILTRRIGLPAVHMDVSFSAPVRYGDGLRIEASADRIGNRSATIRYKMFRQSDGVLSADFKHTVVTTDLGSFKSCDMPADVRAALTAHLAPPDP